MHTGANQTADQDRLFGVHVRAYAALTDATADPRTWRFETARLVAAATGTRTHRPGPVQLNVELSEPLTPTGFAGAPVTTELAVTAVGRADRPTELAAGPQTVIVAGDATPAVGRSRGRAGRGGRGSGAGRAVQQRAVRPGGAGHRAAAGRLHAWPRTSSGWSCSGTRRCPGRSAGCWPATTWSWSWSRRTRTGSTRPGGNSGHLRRAVRGTGRIGLAEPLAVGRRRAAGRAGSAAGRARRISADRPWPPHCGPAWPATRCCSSARPRRSATSTWPRSRTHPPTVYANRGLAGIDGNLSTAAGIALATGSPTTALVGDLTALHDLTGLLRPATEPRPGPAGGGGQRRRRQHLRHPRAGRAGALRGVRTALRHAARG